MANASGNGTNPGANALNSINSPSSDQRNRRTGIPPRRISNHVVPQEKFEGESTDMNGDVFQVNGEQRKRGQFRDTDIRIETPQEKYKSTEMSI